MTTTDEIETEPVTDQTSPVGELCSAPVDPPRQFDHGFHPGRESAIVQNDHKWVSGTTLHYYFLDRDEFPWDRDRLRWGRTAEQEQVVRDAFERWEAVGMGVSFAEVDQASEAEIRIGFLHGDGSWSWLGRRILDEPVNARTMNFGWDLTGQPDTALHEIGHTLGMPHEHQNPFSGIVWDEERVYAALAAPPNEWTRDKTFFNILRKLPVSSVSGSAWDPDSVMHYPFGAGLIKVPERFQNEPLVPAGGLSDADETWMRTWYPPVGDDLPVLRPFRSVPVHVAPGEQAQFLLEPDATRTHVIRTLGEADTVMVLFEQVDGEWRHLASVDDSGQDLNAVLHEKLFQGRRYKVHVRLYWAADSGDFAVIMF